MNDRVYRYPIAQIHTLYVQKVERKGRTRQEVDEVLRWHTGYTQPQLEEILVGETDLEGFFTGAPMLNPNRSEIRGLICGVRIEDIEDPLMREIRYADKLVDELAKGRPMEKILRR